MINYEKYKHHNLDIEKAIIGACLIENGAIARILELIKPEYFYGKENALLIGRMLEMRSNGRKIDILTVAQSIDHDAWKKISIDNPAYYIANCTGNVVSTANLEEHAIIIRQLYGERMAVEIQMQAGTGGFDGLADVDRRIKALYEIKSTDDWVSIDQVITNDLIKHMKSVNGGMTGIPTPYPSLDKVTSGLQPGQLIVIGARPSIGKSAVAGSIALHAAQQGYKVGIISLEMPNSQLAGRLMSLESGIEFWRIWKNRLTYEQNENWNQHIVNLSARNIFLSSELAQNVSQIHIKAEKLRNREGIDMIIIDYLQLMGAEDNKGKNNRERDIAEMTRKAKVMAMELQMPVVMLAQLNRASETTGDKKPKLHNLRESGAIEQDADVVILLHRDKDKEREDRSNGNFGPYPAWLLVEKNRNGETPEIPCMFDGERMRYYEETIPVANDSEQCNKF